MARKPRTAGEVLRARILKDVVPADVAGEVLVDEICRTADLVEKLEQAIAKSGVVIAGARGQVIQHPAIAGLARHRKLLVDLVEKAFPDDQQRRASQRGKTAARSRWN